MGAHVHSHPGTEAALSDPVFERDVTEHIAALHRIGEPVDVAGRGGVPRLTGPRPSSPAKISIPPSTAAGRLAEQAINCSPRQRPPPADTAIKLTPLPVGAINGCVIWITIPAVIYYRPFAINICRCNIMD